MLEDENTKRIYFLITNYLVKVVDSGWEQLYKDPADNRYWKLHLKESELHGGGPPSLLNIIKEDI